MSCSLLSSFQRILCRHTAIMKYSKAAQLSTFLAIATLLSSPFTPSTLAFPTAINEAFVLVANETANNESVVDASDDELRDAFFSSEYTYEDAVALSEFWGETPYDTKAIMGEKLLLGDDFEQSLIEKLEIAKRQKAKRPLTEEEIFVKELNAFFDSEYTYYDAFTLSQYWEQSISESKARIGRKLMWGNNDLLILADSLQVASAELNATEQNLEPGAMRHEQDAFFDSEEYDYWDAAVLADYWNRGLGETKARIGRLLLSGTQESMNILGNSLADARIRRIDALDISSLVLYGQYLTPEGDYLTYDDALELAEYWGFFDVDEAKLQVEEKLILSQPEVVDQALLDI